MTRQQFIVASLVLCGLTLVLGRHTPMRAQVYGRQMPGQAAPARGMRLANPQDFYRHGSGPGLSIRQFDWGYREVAPPKEIKVHDIVTILVDEKSEVTLNSRFDRTRRAEFKAALDEFIRFAGNGSVQNTAQSSPTIDLSQEQRMQSTGRATDQEGVRSRIAATVVDVRPNGYLVLEARKSVHTNQDFWEYSLTGIMRPDDILPNNTALSENIADLDIVKTQKGRIYNSTRLAWGSKLIDMLWPF